MMLRTIAAALALALGSFAVTAAVEPPPEGVVVRDRRAHERGPDAIEHVLLWALDDVHEGKHVFRLRDLGIGRRTVHDRGP